ncbi:hypothetical protein Q1695_003738 [Nippostrongylus brasiliensis]|nr:hypothetical protein Q1695_003738 [Nippostrongylus brasiliensis]
MASEMSRVNNFCCECAATQSRCSADNCPCVAARKTCDEHCESTRYRGDCLNQAICKCSCEVDPAKPAKNACSKAERCDCLRIKEGCSKLCACKQICKNKVSVKIFRKDFVKILEQKYRGDCLNQAICKCSCEVDPAKPAKNACSKAERCDCLRIKEGCSKLCACKQICKNKEQPKKVVKVTKPEQGCQCAKSKKQCVKKECPCRTVYEFCSISCKCCGDCTNGAAKFSVPKHVQNCFLDHKHESSGLIVSLLGEDYIYRGDFYHESKGEPHVEEQLVANIYDLTKYNVELHEIVIFVSKSPCFHQDCEPKCEVVDECRSNKACAKLLGLLLSKVRKELKKVDVKMTVKFLYPHLNRGDLYTKQGILCMLQAGIKVEPLLMKDWCAIMDWSPNVDHKGDYLQLWNNHHLDKAVAQSQLFINECRRALGLSMKFWVAEIHEIVKNTILHFSELRVKCGDLNDALKQLDLTATPHKIKSTPSKRRSFIDLLELRDKLMRSSTEHKKNGSHVSVASDDAQAQAMVASFCGRSFDDCETDEIAQRIRRATANINVEIETLMEFLTHKGAIS